MIFARVVGFGGENLVDVAHVVLLDDRRRVEMAMVGALCRNCGFFAKRIHRCRIACAPP